MAAVVERVFHGQEVPFGGTIVSVQPKVRGLRCSPPVSVSVCVVVVCEWSSRVSTARLHTEIGYRQKSTCDNDAHVATHLMCNPLTVLCVSTSVSSQSSPSCLCPTHACCVFLTLSRSCKRGSGRPVLRAFRFLVPIFLTWPDILVDLGGCAREVLPKYLGLGVCWRDMVRMPGRLADK